jgi:hypothetical protein
LDICYKWLWWYGHASIQPFLFAIHLWFHDSLTTISIQFLQILFLQFTISTPLCCLTYSLKNIIGWFSNPLGPNHELAPSNIMVCYNFFFISTLRNLITIILLESRWPNNSSSSSNFLIFEPPLTFFWGQNFSTWPKKGMQRSQNIYFWKKIHQICQVFRKHFLKIRYLN